MAPKPQKQISIIERRLQGPSALYTSSEPIPATEKGWVFRWENSEISPGQIWTCISKLGWEYVTPKDIACSMEEIGAKAQDDRVVRGIRGQEVLLKMRERDYLKIRQRKTQENIDLTFNKGKTKNAMVNEVAGQFGAEAADFVNNARITELVDSRVEEG